MNARHLLILCTVLTTALSATAQNTPSDNRNAFEDASTAMQQQLEQALRELKELREKIAEEKVPLSRKLNELESELLTVRRTFQDTSRQLDRRTLDLSNLRSEIEQRRQEATYLSNLLSEYIRNFESRLHIAESQRYEDAIEHAKLAPENDNLSQQQLFEAQAAIVDQSLTRLEDILGGTRFDGTAVNDDGTVKPGTFAMLGPAALFRSNDGEDVGTVDQRLGSLEPSIIGFEKPQQQDAAAQIVAGTGKMFPFDPTLGNAHKIEASEDTLWQHIQKGGPVMVPIFALAGAALLVALYKWVGLALVRKPAQKQIDALLGAVARKDSQAAKEHAGAIKGPAGQMLTTGVEHMDEPRDLIEEVMYEKVLSTRLKLQRLLPFIAITAAAAPLLGLLGTVTGIINTFELITVFGTGDVQTLSGGISEALITTEFGLIVAIPSLLLHAFLSRKARSVVDQMQKVAVSFVNQVDKSRERRHATAMNNGASVPHDHSMVSVSASHAGPANHERAAAASPTTQQVREILADLLVPAVQRNIDRQAEQTQSAQTGSDHG